MAPTRMNLRVRRRDNAATAGGGAREEEAAAAEPVRRRESRRKKSKAPPPAAVPEVTVATAAAAAAAEEASPDSKCPICLDRFDNVAFLDRCLHRFCFPCIQEWSHSKAECPLCKQPFASILHSVRAEDDFKEYTLRPPPASGGVSAVAMVAAMATVARSSHQMRLTLRRHRAPDGGEAAAAALRRRARDRGGARRAEDGGAGVWEWYLDPPPPNRRHATMLDEQPLRPEMSSEERGVIFEGLAGLEGPETPVAPNDRASRRLMTRLAARRRLQREGGTPRRLREREALALRRALYRSGVRVRDVAGASGDSAQQQQRDVSADGFRRSPALLNRLRPWLRRELTVLYGAHDSLVEIVQRIITVRLARHGLEDPPAIEEELRPFLLARTEHFLHELASFARSPLSMDSYDLQAVYEPPAAAAGELDWISSSSDGSSVIAISEEEEEEEEEERGRGPEEAGFAQVGGASEDACLSMSGWDDETPGPSYSSANADQSCSLTSPAASPAPAEAGPKGEEEECLIVGYKKPIAERTPELVQLSSDSEEERQGAEPQPEAPPVPPEAPPLSFLPTIPASTSAAFREEPGGGGEEAGPRLRSWSGSSRNSACTISPATTPDGGDGKRRRETAAWREKRRKRRKKRRRGTLYNPNRSIYPAMMRRHRRSSGESGSPASPAPSSSWEISSLCSSDSSSSSSSSSSPLSFSPPPPLTPPPPAACDGGGGHGEKPGGKRKYKSRHLDNEVKDPTWRPRRRRRGRDGGSRRSREQRSPSVEIVYEGTVAPGDAHPPSNKRRRRRRHRAQQGSSPVVITLDSDSGAGGSPLDFSRLPPLPLAPAAGVGGAVEAHFGELPVDILDRGSDGSVAGSIPSDGSERLDVENVDVSGGAHEQIGGAGPGSEGGGAKLERSDILPLTFDLSHSPGGGARRDSAPRLTEGRSSSPTEAPALVRGRGLVWDRDTPLPLNHKDAGGPPGPAPPLPDLHLVQVKPPDDGLTTTPAGPPLDRPDRPPSLRTSLGPAAEVDHTVPPHTHQDLLQGPPDLDPVPPHPKLPQDFHLSGRSLDSESDAAVRKTDTQTAT